MTVISKNIDLAAKILQANEVIAIPTETVYGLAANIYNEKAVKKIYSLKNRPHSNPLIVHVSAINKVEELVTSFPEKAKQLAKAFWPGPLTLILPKSPKVPNWITADKQHVAIRIPKHKTTLELLKKITFPLAAPSANPFMRISPTTAKHCCNYFNDKIELILDGGACEKGIESTIVSFHDAYPTILRLGSISIEEIKDVVGETVIHNNTAKEPVAPGMYSKHYSPKTNLVLVEEITPALINTLKDEKIAALTFNKAIKHQKIIKCLRLTKTSDLKEAAKNLYSFLHQLDNINADIILAEKVPFSGIGITINDRLLRASHQ